MGKENRDKLGLEGKQHVERHYSFLEFEKKWVTLMDKIVEEKGSWKNRKKHNGITFKEVA